MSFPEKLCSPRIVRQLLKEHEIRLRQRWGQHFLCDENILDKIIAAAQLHRGERVFEIGAGLGTLTQAIAPLVRAVIAVEIDPRLIPILREQLAEHPNVRLIQADVLKLDWRTLLPVSTRLKVMGNLPYGITSPLLARLIEHRDLFGEALLMVQREVAEKLIARPGRRETSSLGIFVQVYCDVELLLRVSRNCFYPRPEVDSALVRLSFLERPRFLASEECFMAIVHAALGMRRKTLRQALTLSPQLSLSREHALDLLHQTGIEETRRGETLTLEELDRLAQALEERFGYGSSH